MKHSLLAALSVMLMSTSCFGQYTGDKQKIEAVREIIDGYNARNYAMMLMPCDSEFKAAVTDSLMAGEYGPMYKQHGKAAIVVVAPTFSSEDHYVAKLSMEKQPAERLYWQFYFNDRSEVVGYGAGYPNMFYRKFRLEAPLNQHYFAKRVDSLLTARHLKSTTTPFNGAVKVLDNGKTVYSRCFGYADFSTNALINDSTMFDLASCSKQFTAVATLMLVKQGKLRLTDSVQQFIPGFPYHGITIDHLLAHTSGLPDYEGPAMIKKWDSSKVADNQDMLQMLLRIKPKSLFAPGERFSYCNTGYALLPIIIEKVSGEPFADFMRQHIFLPLGMTHTRVCHIQMVKDEQIANCTTGYLFSEEKRRYEAADDVKPYARFLGGVVGDGSVYSCTRDLERWEREVLDSRVIGRDIFQQAFTSHMLSNGRKTGYGSGYLLTGGPGMEPVTFHTGGWPGYVSMLLNFPEQKKQIIILSNTDYEGFTKMADEIAELLAAN